MSEMELTTRPKRIAVLLDRHVGYRENVLRGVWRYGLSAGWLCRGAGLWEGSPRQIAQWGADGIVVGLWSDDAVLPLGTLGIPIVDIFTWLEHGLPRVGIEEEAVGRLAASHLLERQLRSYAFVGQTRLRFARLRLNGFQQELARHNLTCAIWDQNVPVSVWDLVAGDREMDAQIGPWLASLPRPAGVFAANDDVGVQVTDACRRAGLRVPDDVAVLGVDNDELLCQLSHPPLSSIETSAQRIGYAAAELLDRLMRRQTAHDVHLLPPTGVVARQSTDVLAIDDPDLVEAVRWLRANAVRGANIADLLRHVPISRRALEMKFAKVLGHSPHDELRRVRIERAKDLLANTDMPMSAIALKCGFPHAERMASVFRQSEGQTPTAYRRQFQLR